MYSMDSDLVHGDHSYMSGLKRTQEYHSLHQIFLEHGIHPPANCIDIPYSDTEDSSDTAPKVDSTYLLTTTFGSVNFDYLPTSVRNIRNLRDVVHLILNLFGINTVQNANSSTIFQSYGDMIRNSLKIFFQLIKFIIFCSFFLRSVIYFYKNLNT